ncbi:MAG TPA: hypothetical protein VIY28_10360 [Pseudonocardiaceae bacterium]
MAGCSDRVTWRLELPGAWGGRLDPAWLPTSGTDSWRRVFEGEDLAARVFAAGGAGLRWAQLADAAAVLGPHFGPVPAAVVGRRAGRCRMPDRR